MRIISLFTIYFLVLMVVHGFVAVFVDSRIFRKKNSIGAARKARWLGLFVITISVILYILKNIL